MTAVDGVVDLNQEVVLGPVIVIEIVIVVIEVDQGHVVGTAVVAVIEEVKAERENVPEIEIVIGTVAVIVTVTVIGIGIAVAVLVVIVQSARVRIAIKQLLYLWNITKIVKQEEVEEYQDLGKSPMLA